MMHLHEMLYSGFVCSPPIAAARCGPSAGLFRGADRPGAGFVRIAQLHSSFWWTPTETELVSTRLRGVSGF